MGGPMSVNDELPWILPAMQLIRAAVAQGIPVLGHCLGGQLMAKAMGGVVSRNAVKEIGWGQVRLTPQPVAQDWFGQLTEPFQVFHWHGETFSLPQGATPLLYSAHCTHQAFSIGPHLALQCHIEMTELMILAWCQAGKTEIEASLDSPVVQTEAQILSDLPTHLMALHRLADSIYTRWLEGISHHTS
jgi:GMP synthase-like glutamine amidotransferase